MSRRRSREAALLAGLMIVAASALPARRTSAEPIGTHAYLMPFGGYTMFRSDSVGFGIAPELKDKTYVGGRLGYRFRPWASLELGFGYTPTRETTRLEREVDFLHVAADVLLTPFGGDRARPFLLVGGGASRLTPNGGDRVNQGNAELGGGIDFWFTDGFGLRLEARDVMWLPKDDLTKVRTHTAILGAGLAFAFGARSRDSDGDGVPDRTDSCADTPKGATVDEKGCTKDTDGDGVLDGLDQCVDTPKGATVNDRGCPTDADGDGVWDGLDQCADTPKGASVNARGCPTDADGDQVWDGLDQCADTPKGATVDAKGCPSDSDGDGVPNGLDECPDTVANLRVDKNGCPIEVMEKETELLDTGMIRLQNVNFETNKADILPESFGVLDVVGQVLRQWTELRIEIGGHADSRGPAARNQKLSEARAESVKRFLTGKYPELKPDQFTSRGYGEARPLVPNTTDLNMAKNRRVEFVVLNKDVLRKEMERRRMLRQGEGAPADTTRR